MINVNKNESVVTLELNRPEAMNAFNFSMLRELGELISDIRYDRSIRVVVLTGAGDKAFSAGADLKERAGYTDAQVKQFVTTIRNLFNDIENLNKPVIGAINGVALGGGAELAMACDIRIASNTSRIGLTETRLGVIPGAGGTQRLPRLVGTGKAKELIFTGKIIDAVEALDIGLVNTVCSPGELGAECEKMAGLICEASPIGVEQAKYAINHGAGTDINSGLAIESSAYWVTIPTKDRQEALLAFREKRKPVFRGE